MEKGLDGRTRDIAERVHFQIPFEAIPGGAESRGGEFTPRECEEGVALAGNGEYRGREREGTSKPNASVEQIPVYPPYFMKALCFLI